MTENVFADALVPEVDDPQFADLIETFTVPARVPLAPEIEMYLATHITPLWQATEDILGVLDIPPPYWAFAWPGGQAITRYILDHPEMVRGKRVLDFACGGGMQAIACVMAGAADILANDIDPVAITATRLNAKHNDVEFPTTTENFVGTSAPEKRWDVIFAGDVCYQQDMANAVLQWLMAEARLGTRVILADPGRTYAPTHNIDELETYDVPVDVAVEDTDTKFTRIWQLLPDRENLA
ncbi:class I SAM-dependent methyltransferase [Thalassospira lucentensis]|uniref:class I SAM-dependent methyltransferase n=1 Tax=Thalassospira lucentensis TaxID=168935 RepID=UPI00142E306D|nr:50S ribosomal protein L11 methyltransferase [Thalassospira lucentensis]NIZ01503.1 methyltransferase [Thalassospira lucentensis]